MSSLVNTSNSNGNGPWLDGALSTAQKGGFHLEASRRHANLKTSVMSLNAFWSIAIFFYILVYELVFFNVGLSDLGSPIWFFKLAFPAVMLIAGLVGSGSNSLGSTTNRRYLLVFSAFIAVALFPSAAIGGMESVLAWSRYAVRLVFCAAIIILVQRDRSIFTGLSKLIVIWAVASVIQYLLLIVTQQYTTVGLFYAGRVALAGPFGLLGNVNSFTEKPSLAIPLVRLCGFWLEPSNASAFLFSSCFLASFLGGIGQRWVWRGCAAVCFIGGCLCLSNAGYCALGAAIACGALIRTGPHLRTQPHRILTFLLGASLSCFGLLGRWFVEIQMPGAETASALTGVKDTGLGFSGMSVSDFSEGRLDLLFNTLQSVRTNPFGTGVTVSGAEGTFDVSASAPIFWLKLTGVMGLAFLLLREAVVVKSIYRSGSVDPARKAIAQAWVAILVQNMSYGTWMSPMYLVITAGLLVFEVPSSQRLPPGRGGQMRSTVGIARTGVATVTGRQRRATL